MRPSDGSQQAYCQSVGVSSTNYPHLDTRDPTSNDVYYPIGKLWQNTTSNSLWYLNSFTSTGGILQAFWTEISNAATSILEIVTNSGSATPIAGILNLLASNGLTFQGSSNTVQLNNDLQFTGNTGTANFSSGNLNIVGADGTTVTMSGSTATISGFSNVQTSVANSNNYNFTWTAPAQARMYEVQIGVFSSGIAGGGTYAIATMYLHVTSLFGFPATVSLIPLTILSQHSNVNGYTIIITPTAAVNNQISFNVTNANGFTITVTSVEIGTYNTS